MSRSDVELRLFCSVCQDLIVRRSGLYNCIMYAIEDAFIAASELEVAASLPAPF